MRIFFLFLLIVNLLFAAWQYTQPERQPAQIRPLPANLQTVQLLNKSLESPPVDGTKESQVSEALPQAGILQAEKAVHCYTLGPFNDEATVQRVKSHISEQVENLMIRRREESEPHRYWIYLPPQESRQQAIAMSKALARQKVNDYYIVRSGAKNNSISLGHFKEKTHADRRVNKLNKLGFDAQMEVVYRQYNLFWLDYSVAGGQAVSDDLLAPFLVDGVARLGRDCD